MARVPQDTGDERLIPEPELLGGLRAAGAEILASRQLGMVPDFTPPTLLRAAAPSSARPRAPRSCAASGAHNVILAAKRDGRTRA